MIIALIAYMLGGNRVIGSVIANDAAMREYDKKSYEVEKARDAAIIQYELETENYNLPKSNYDVVSGIEEK